jgi:DNA repair protein RadC
MTNPPDTPPDTPNMPPDGRDPAQARHPDHQSGHRARMRGKLLAKGATAFSELELLEMLLYAGNPRADTKPLAKDLMTSFGSLSAVLRAPAKSLRDHRGMGDAAVAALKIVEAAGLHLSHSDIHNRHVLASWSEV